MKNLVKGLSTKLMATLFVLGFFSSSVFAQGDNGVTGSSLSAVQVVLGLVLLVALLVIPAVKGSSKQHRHA